MNTITTNNIYAYPLFKKCKYVIIFKCSMANYDYCAIDSANTLIGAIFTFLKKYYNDNLNYKIIKNF